MAGGREASEFQRFLEAAEELGSYTHLAAVLEGEFLKLVTSIRRRERSVTASGLDWCPEQPRLLRSEKDSLSASAAGSSRRSLGRFMSPGNEKSLRR